MNELLDNQVYILNKFFNERKDFIKLYQKIGQTDFSKFWVIHSINNKDFNS